MIKLFRRRRRPPFWIPVEHGLPGRNGTNAKEPCLIRCAGLYFEDQLYRCINGVWIGCMDRHIVQGVTAYLPMSMMAVLPDEP